MSVSVAVPQPAIGEPCSDAEPWSHLPAAALRAWHVDNAVGLALALTVLGLLGAVGLPEPARSWLLPVAGLAVLAALVESAVVLPRRHRSYRYRAGDHVVVVETGLLLFHQLVVPVSQILYVETVQGPVLRALGLSKLRLGTIADAKTLGPLTCDAAAALRDIVESARSHRCPDGPTA